MLSGLIGTKVGMTCVLDERGRLEPVTVVQAGPCVVTQVKNRERDGYDAVQLGFGDVKPHRVTKPRIGHCAAAGAGPRRVLREVRLSAPAELSTGDVVTVQTFLDDEVKYVDVVGITKGKGTAGVMKRHGFGGSYASHGTERKHRSAGSIGGHSTRGTGRGVKKGKRMAGHMGHVSRTASTLQLMKVDPDNNLLLIRGSVPGPNGSVVMIRRAKRKG